MTVFDLSIKLLNISSFVYLMGSVFFILGISFSAKNNVFLKWGQYSAYAAFAAHSLGLLGRWYLGGISRPPWTNLYESLVFFSWGLSLLQVLALHRWKLPLLGLIASPLIFLVMGMSVMTPNKLVEPLIPALQSNWLKIHVVFGMLSYAGFTTAACFAFLYLVKSRSSLSKMMGGLALLTALNLAVSGGPEFFRSGQFTLAKSTTRELPNGTLIQVKDTYREFEGGPILTRVESVPGGNFCLGLGIFSFLLAAFLSLKNPKKVGGKDLSSGALGTFQVGLLSMLGLFISLGVAVYRSTELTLYSNSYLLFLLLMSFIFSGILMILHYRYEKILSLLPSASRLDELSYKNILFAFPFQTLLLITGAIWAYYAWGRSWGWDPKETWAFITWLAFLIYLHGKLLLRWKAPLLSFVALCGFFILVFAFLGVNLVLSGLHSYGSA